MFGYRKGAFTGADRDKPGLLETPTAARSSSTSSPR
jgi:transcriptional regulator with PAS, ATPase and Fis domain